MQAVLRNLHTCGDRKLEKRKLLAPQTGTIAITHGSQKRGLAIGTVL